MDVVCKHLGRGCVPEELLRVEGVLGQELAPGVQAPLGTGKMAFRHGEDELALDFGIDSDAPLLPMRVIG